MIRKNGNRFSEKIMLKQKDTARNSTQMNRTLVPSGCGRPLLGGGIALAKIWRTVNHDGRFIEGVSMYGAVVTRAADRGRLPEHDPEKRRLAFRKDHAETKRYG
jgi:hypothetical protein